MWLSARVRRRNSLPKRLRWWGRGYRLEGFQCVLHRLHPFSRSALLGSAIVATTFSIVLLWSLFTDRVVTTDRAASLTAWLATASEVLAGLGGLLFAVIIFALQFHAQRLGHTAFLVRYLPRREGLVPIAAFLLGTLLSFLLVQLLASAGLSTVVIPMAWWGAILLFIVFLLVLWLFYRMVASIAGDFIRKSVIPGLTFEYERLLDEEVRHTRFVAAYLETLSYLSLKYSTTAAGGGYLAAESYEFSFTRQGTIRDVDINALFCLERDLQSTCPGYSAELTIAPGDTVTGDSALVITKRPSVVGEPLPTDPSFTIGLDDLRPVVKELLDRCFYITTASNTSEHDVLAELPGMITRQAQYDTPEQLQQGLEIYTKLTEVWLERTGGIDAPFSFLRPNLVRLVGTSGSQLYQIADKLRKIKDREKIEYYFEFAARLQQLAMDHKHGELFLAAAGQFEFIYYHLSKVSDHADWIGLQLDAWLKIGLNLVRSETEDLNDEDPVLLIVGLRWCLNMIKLAMESNREDDAIDFHLRLLEYDQYRHERLPSTRHYQQQASPAAQHRHDLHSYVNVIVGAWALHQYGDSTQDKVVAKKLFRQAAEEAGTREDLVTVWEAVDHGFHLETGVDDQLALRHWDGFEFHERPARRRISSVHVDRSWLVRGLVGLMLVRESANPHEPSPILDMAPMKKLWSKMHVEAIAKELATKEPLKLNPALAATAIEAVVALVAAREVAFKVEELRKVVEADVDDDSVQAFRRNLHKMLEQNSERLRELQEGMGVDNLAKSQPLPKARYSRYFPKNEFLAGAHTVSGVIENTCSRLGRVP